MNIIKDGDITTCKSGIVVHGCNAQGVMGSGVAAAIRMKWPEAYDSYREAFDWNEDSLIKLGSCDVCKINEELYVVNAITQEFFGGDRHMQYASYDAIHRAFQNINKWVMTLDPSLRHVHFPKIGGKRGGANWNILNAQNTSGINHRAGHHYDTAPPNDGFFSENRDILSTSDSSLTGTLSEANQFPGGITAVWTGISDAPVVIPFSPLWS